eukprot:TRINITY_DN10073_c0_g1_i2.p1 TRINITY_DN10073_c0_g1~~TRINITY_DN10073_c0_g1_i2.p1  ORF type:complete len:495 (-),score=137.96 TRINITY_DN10073_c0_g1_i2:102-1586(-)
MTAIQVAGSAGYTELESMLREKRETMTLLNANHFLEEQAAEEKVKSEQRAIKTAKEKEKRARRKAARRERQQEVNRKKAEEEAELCKIEKLDEVRRREHVRRQRDKARPALISQVHSLMQQEDEAALEAACSHQQGPQGAAAEDAAPGLLVEAPEEEETVTDCFEHTPSQEDIAWAEHTPPEEAVSECLEHTQAQEDCFEHISPQAAGFEEDTFEANLQYLQPALASWRAQHQTLPGVFVALQEEEDAPEEEPEDPFRAKFGELGAGLAQLLDSPSDYGNMPMMLEPIDAALMQCADAVGTAQIGAPSGALDNVEQALTVCMDVITSESRGRALNGGRIQGRSRLALWRDQARSEKVTSVTEQPIEEMCGEIAGAVVEAVCGDEGGECVEPAEANQTGASFVPPRPREVPRAPQTKPASAAVANTPKWQPFAEQVPKGKLAPSVILGAKTAHHNEQPNSSLPRPMGKECSFVPPVPKPRNAKASHNKGAKKMSG